MEPLLPNQIYHIYNHANGYEDIFREEKNYSFFLEKYKKHISPIAETFAYCLLPNHFHLLIKLKKIEDLLDLPIQNIQTSGKYRQRYSEEKISYFLSKQFANLFSSYTQSFNKVYYRRGSLFLKNFKRKPILSPEQFRNTFLYIQLNAVKHKIVKDEKDWKWSSLAAYNDLFEHHLISKCEPIERFDNSENMHFCLENWKEKLLEIDDE